jgi:hypothetical protein
VLVSVEVLNAVLVSVEVLNAVLVSVEVLFKVLDLADSVVGITEIKWIFRKKP